MAKAKAIERPSEIFIEPLETGSLDVWVRGKSPLIMNTMSVKSQRELLFPLGKKTTALRNQSLKHDPIIEYRNSVYRRLGQGPTRLTFPAAAFKGAMADAALEIPGAKKTQIQRLIWVAGDRVDVYGIPQMFMAVTRSADQARTPDIRTRAIIPEWACCVNIEYVKPTLNPTSLARLMEAAGMIIGIGDFRQGKGKGNYGQFTVQSDAKKVEDIVKTGGLAAQDKALETPGFYDVETQNMYTWFEQERKERGK